MTRQLRLAGFFTRAVALVLDAAIVTMATTLAGFAVSLALDLFRVHVGSTLLRGGLGTGGWLVVVGTYFVWFWTLGGQTPGMRFMDIGVISSSGGKLTWAQAVRRFGGMLLSALPVGAGFLLVLVDDRRRGLHDLIGSTLVVHAPRRRLAAPPTTDTPRPPRPQPLPLGEQGDGARLTMTS